jgi:hypothetical protein
MDKFLEYRIKREFAQLLADNEARPEEERLPRNFFDIDPEMKQIVESETRAAEQAVHDEMRWESERQQIAIKKIKGGMLHASAYNCSEEAIWAETLHGNPPKTESSDIPCCSPKLISVQLAFLMTWKWNALCCMLSSLAPR